MTDTTSASDAQPPAAAGAAPDAVLDPAPGAGPVMSTAGTLIERMGIVVTSATAQRVVGTMPVAGNTQPFGLLHGGASAVLAESLGSVGAALHAGPGRMALGVDVNATHHRGARPGPDGSASVTGVATAVHLGRSTAAYEVVITDDDGRRVCSARLTCAVVDVPAP